MAVRVGQVARRIGCRRTQRTRERAERSPGRQERFGLLRLGAFSGVCGGRLGLVRGGEGCDARRPTAHSFRTQAAPGARERKECKAGRVGGARVRMLCLALHSLRSLAAGIYWSRVSGFWQTGRYSRQNPLPSHPRRTLLLIGKNARRGLSQQNS